MMMFCRGGIFSPPFFYGRMELETFGVIGSFSGIAAVAGMLWSVIKIGVWKGKFEEKTDGVTTRLNKADKETASIVIIQHQQNVTLAKMESKLDIFETKLDLLLASRTRGRKV